MTINKKAALPWQGQRAAHENTKQPGKHSIFSGGSK